MTFEAATTLTLTGCDRLYTEDLNASQRFGGVEIINPFAHA
jgi:predicted nucleic acid-binding protein